MKRQFAILIIAFFSLSAMTGQENIKQLTLLYDTSYGMRNKDLTAELQFLDSYFNQYPDTDVLLISFSNDIILEANYKLRDGNWNALKTELQASIYDGAGNYKGLFEGIDTEVMLVTNGRADIEDFPGNFPHKINVICSVTNANQKGLEGLALSSGGTFFNVFATTNEIEEGPGIVKVSGVVTDGDGPLAEVSIYNRDTGARTVSASDGSYALNAKVNGILEYSYVGKNTLLTRVPEDGQKDVLMVAGSEVLDEVVLTATSETDQEQVNTGNMRIAKKRLGYGIESISDEEITEQDITLEQSIQGQFANVNLKPDQDITQFISRGNNMSLLLDQTGLVVIDGVPIESSPSSLQGVNTPSNGIGTGSDRSIFGQGGLIDPANIADITVLKGLAATNKYGTLGRNGVILITTKTAVVSKARARNEAIPMGTTATYTGSAEDMAALPDTPYIKELRQAQNIDQAYEIYLQQREQYGREAYFFIDVASYFKDWNNTVLVNRVLSNAKLVAEGASALRATAYKYEQLGAFDQAAAIYEKLTQAAPRQVQNYRNLALALHKAGRPQEALEIYKGIDNKELAQNGQLGNLRKTYVKEYKNLLFKNKGSLNAQGVNPFYNNNVKHTARVVFEWSDFDAEFDLQIVNPQNRFFTWKHDKQTDALRWAQEQDLGYGLEEFFMTASDTGEWLFNVSYKGKRQGDNSSPTYLKITTYYDFGGPAQRQDIKMIRLEDLSKEQTVLKVDL